MSAIRRQGVIADYGSLARYRQHVLDALFDSTLEVAAATLKALKPEEKAHAAALRVRHEDWKLDLAWVNGEIEKAAAR